MGSALTPAFSAARLLAQIYIETDNNAEAIQTLQFYLKYKPEDVGASITFGRLLFDMGEYEQTITMMDRVTTLERTRTEAYLYRFLSNVELGKGAEADKDLDTAMKYYPDRFDANLALVRAHILNERYGSAEQALANTIALAETDEQKALIYYWAGITYEKRENPKKAIENWQLLLDLPEKAMTADMRAEAEDHLRSIHTATPSPKPTDTKRTTPTKPVTVTVTKTPTATPTGVTKTPTPTATPTK